MNVLYYEVAVLCSFLYGTCYMYENWKGGLGLIFKKYNYHLGLVQIK